MDSRRSFSDVLLATNDIELYGSW